MYYKLDENGNPIKMDSITDSVWDITSRCVRVTDLIFSNEEHTLSTVFLVIDHNYFSTNWDEPILFESLWFGGPLDGQMYRYKTLKEALDGHESLLRQHLQAFTPVEIKEQPTKWFGQPVPIVSSTIKWATDFKDFL